MSERVRVIERAHAMLAERDALGRPPRGLSMPFGVIDPDAWHWRVSRDVRDALLTPVYIEGSTEAIGLLTSMVIGGRETVTDRLLGITVDVGSDLPPRSMILEAATG